MAFQSFEDLHVWQRGKDLAIEVYRNLADCRDFGLRDQMQRAAVSIPSNIAEGYERSPRTLPVLFPWLSVPPPNYVPKLT